MGMFCAIFLWELYKIYLRRDWDEIGFYEIFCLYLQIVNL